MVKKKARHGTSATTPNPPMTSVAIAALEAAERHLFLREIAVHAAAGVAAGHRLHELLKQEPPPPEETIIAAQEVVDYGRAVCEILVKPGRKDARSEARAGRLSKLFPTLDVALLKKAAEVRNKVEHFDEYLDAGLADHGAFYPGQNFVVCDHDASPNPVIDLRDGGGNPITFRARFGPTTGELAIFGYAVKVFALTDQLEALAVRSQELLGGAALSADLSFSASDVRLPPRVVSGQTFEEEEVEIDGATFTSCRFIRCTIVYSGGRYGFRECEFSPGLGLLLKGAALRTANLMVAGGIEPRAVPLLREMDGEAALAALNALQGQRHS